MDRVGAVSGPAGQQSTTPWTVFDAWLRRATAVVGESAEGLNAINVYPVPDSDTGTNLRLTLDGIGSAVPGVTRDDLDTMVQAAILSAHGNSGAIVAEMLTSVARQLPDQGDETPAGARLAALLRVAAVAARRAVARPVEGTIVTVAEAAADAAEAARSDHPDDALAVAEAAQRAAREALARTPDQLEALAAAGVVDAGGQAYVLLVDALVETLGGEPAQPLAVRDTAAVAARPRENGRPPVEYEVMYALRGAPAAGREALRERLSALGHSVVLVGDQSVAQVHVHLREAGAAIEAALGSGAAQPDPDHRTAAGAAGPDDRADRPVRGGGTRPGRCGHRPRRDTGCRGRPGPHAGRADRRRRARRRRCDHPAERSRSPRPGSASWRMACGARTGARASSRPSPRSRGWPRSRCTSPPPTSSPRSWR